MSDSNKNAGVLLYWQFTIGLTTALGSYKNFIHGRERNEKQLGQLTKQELCNNILVLVFFMWHANIFKLY